MRDEMHYIDQKPLYFNSYEFNKIYNIRFNNPYKAVEDFEKYIEKYPYDYTAKVYYISSLISINELEKANKIFKNIEDTYDKLSEILKKENRIDIIKEKLLICKLKLLLYQKKYAEAVTLYFSNYDSLKSLGGFIGYYLSLLRGSKIIINKKEDSYITKQVTNYSEDEFMEHIKKHMADYNQNDSTISKTYFSHEFPLSEVLQEVKKYIPSSKKLCYGFYDNTYIFKYNECGRDNNKIVDYFKVITFDKDDKYITMCPSANCDFLPYVDLNYLKKETNDEQNVKRLSQIEKFRKKYNL